MAEFKKTSQQKILELIRSFDGPAKNEVLHWEVDYGENVQDYKDLGPRPRRTALFEIIGSLADRGLVELTTAGVVALPVNE